MLGPKHALLTRCQLTSVSSSPVAISRLESKVECWRGIISLDLTVSGDDLHFLELPSAIFYAPTKLLDITYRPMTARPRDDASQDKGLEVSLDLIVLTWDRLTFGGGQHASFAASFGLGRKDCSVDFPTDSGWTYETCTELARKTMILLYGSNDQTDWLLDGATALVHMARASLTADCVGKRYKEVLDKSHYIRHHEDTLSTKEALLLNANVEMFTTSEQRKETSAATRTPMLDMISAAANVQIVSGLDKEPQSRTECKRVEVPWTYRDLVLRLWHKLERLQADSQTPAP